MHIDHFSTLIIKINTEINVQKYWLIYSLKNNQFKFMKLDEMKKKNEFGRSKTVSFHLYTLFYLKQITKT